VAQISTSSAIVALLLLLLLITLIVIRIRLFKSGIQSVLLVHRVMMEVSYQEVACPKVTRNAQFVRPVVVEHTDLVAVLAQQMQSAHHVQQDSSVMEQLAELTRLHVQRQRSL
jgi:hypothetical protein